MRKVIFVIVLLFATCINIAPQSKCKQWDNRHQHFNLAIIDGRIYGVCGSCGELIPIRTEPSGEVAKLDSVYAKWRIKFVPSTQEEKPIKIFKLKK